MNIPTTECSSGCESGWTMYFDQQSYSYTDQYAIPFDNNDYQRRGAYVNHEEEDHDDLSMVSDASSGPPQFHEYENLDKKNKKINNKKKKKVKEQKGKEKNLYLDDTASSNPLCHFSQEILEPASSHFSMEQVPEFSQDLPAGQFQKHFGFFKSSQKETSASAKSGGFFGRKRQ